MLLILLFVFRCPKYLILGAWDHNRLLGWGWDVPNLQILCHLYSVISLIIFTLSYGVIYYFGKRPNRILSILHILFIVFFLITPLALIEIEILLGILIWTTFLLNLFFSNRSLTAPL